MRYRERKGIAIAVAGCLLFGAAWSCVACAGDLPPLRVQCLWPEPYNLEARTAVLTPLAVQAQNGQILDQTLYNHHFQDGSDRLRPSGQMLLDRLARRHGDHGVQIYLQTARDVPYDPDQLDAMTKERSSLDTKRAQAVRTYLAYTRPDVAYTLSLNDPGTRGLPSLEAARPVRELLGTAKGILPPEMQQRLSDTIQGPGSLAPSTSLSGEAGTGNAAVLGTSAGN